MKRWEHEAVVDAMQARLEHDPGKMKVRRQTVEHPFGTLKYWMGATHFLTKTLGSVRVHRGFNWSIQLDTPYLLGMRPDLWISWNPAAKPILGGANDEREQSQTLPRVSTEMSLHVLAYNLKRMMSIFGIAGLLEAIRA